MSDIADKLNGLYSTFFNNKNNYPVDLGPIECNEVDSLDNSYVPVSGFVADISVDDPAVKDSGIVRSVFGWRAAERMSNDYLAGMEFLPVLKNAMLKAAAKKFNLSTCDINFEPMAELTGQAGINIILKIQRKTKTQGE